MSDQSGTRIVAVSNRLPITLKRKNGEWVVEPGSGGLVTALAPVLGNRGGLWIGWPGTVEQVDADLKELFAKASIETGYNLLPLFLSQKEVDNYYHGFSNEIIWPLFHDLQTRANFVPEYWYSYLEVNRKFAHLVAKKTSNADYIWVHDYHLMFLARFLKEMGTGRRSGFFLHIPFPPVDIFMKLPWRVEILRALLDYDLIGFQTMRDRRNFTQCLQYVSDNIKINGRGMVVSVNYRERQTRLGAFPISIDVDEFAKGAASKVVTDESWYLHEQLPERKILLGIDRLDYTKGIPERLEAFRNALERFPDMHRKVSLMQVVVPSREGVPEYQALRSHIEQLVSEINGHFTTMGWIPIHYIYRNLSRNELLAAYRTAEIGLITPLKDGMNLVAKEYCACQLEEDGVLILSEFAGAAAQLFKDALIVNPYDIEGVAEAIHKAFVMPVEERKTRMKKLRENIRKFDIYRWVDSFLLAAFARQLGDFPMVDDFSPVVDFDI